MEGLVDVEQWAELRSEHFVREVSVKELVRRTGLSRGTVRAALRALALAKYEWAPQSRHSRGSHSPNRRCTPRGSVR